MTYNPNANWTAEIDTLTQAPVYFLRIDGIATHDYSTHPVKSAAVTKKIYMASPPRGGQVSADIIDGSQTVQNVEVELLDVNDEITDLVATEATGAPVSTLINRKATIYGGYRSLAESDYPAVYTGRIIRVKMNPQLTGYIFTLATLDRMLDGEIMLMSAADQASSKTASIAGNIVNVYWAILSGTFSTTHGTFPLDSVSTATTTTVAPTGLGIDTALLNETQMTDERDVWHAEDKVDFTFQEPENGKEFLEDEIFRVFQAFPAISADGLLGLKFYTPSLAPSAAKTLTANDHILRVRKWERLYRDHINQYRLEGDYDEVDDEFDTELYNTDTSEDTADRTATDETIQIKVLSRGMTTALDGVEIANELMGRLRARYLKTPAFLEVDVNFRKRNVERGDVLAVTHPQLPDLVTGTRGLTTHLMTCVSVAPRFDDGVLTLRLVDTGFDRFGTVQPNTIGDYTSATAQEQNTHCWIGATSTNLLNSGTERGYRMT